MNRFETTVVIPAYNESTRLPATLTRLAELCREGFSAIDVREVIVVNDGSADDTQKVAESFAAQLPGLLVLDSGRNFGKGHAVRTGMARATQPWILIADADMSTPWTEADKLAESCASADADVAIASRDLPASQISRHQSFVREHLGKSFNIFLRGVTGLPFRDTQCGFKLIKREKVKSFLGLLAVDRFAWDVEFLIFARDFSLKTVEIPVAWKHMEHSRVRIVRDGFEMLCSVIKVRVRSNVARRRLAAPNH